MKEQITESECTMRGCCWNEAYTQDSGKWEPVKGMPWCFFPGGAAECSLAQAAKDSDPTIKAASLAYHESGDFATSETYRKACTARGDHFYSWYLTPETWYDWNGDYSWKSTKVSLVKFGCVAAKCSNPKEIERMMIQIGAEQNRDEYPSGLHASLKFNVTGYSYITKEDKPVTPDTPTPSPAVKEEGMGAVGAIALAALSIMLMGTTGMAFHFYRQLPETSEGILDKIYVRQDSFPAADNFGAPPEKPSALGPQVRDSLLNSAV